MSLPSVNSLAVLCSYLSLMGAILQPVLLLFYLMRAVKIIKLDPQLQISK